MRTVPATAMLIAGVVLSGCGIQREGSSPSQKWTTGFWYWHGSSMGAAALREPLDVLYIHVGSISGEPPNSPPWGAYGELPDRMPEAREYWLVYRFEREGLPHSASAQVVAEQVARLAAEARKRNLNLAGVQLDIDSPTKSLTQYAAFLREVRKGLPQGFELSITALLDWFRNGTAIGDVIKEVDEFVPQFYDIGDARNGAIAAKIDAEKWGPVFNRFDKRFRIGVSDFGRARLVSEGAVQGTSYPRFSVSFRDLTPMTIATNPSFELHTSRTSANELVLSYRATRKVKIEYNTVEQGETLQFTLATPESVGDAVAGAKRMGGNMAGVIFFRWPSADEPLAMPPEDALRAAGVLPTGHKSSSVRVNDGHCAAVTCVDVFFEIAEPLAPEPRRYRIHSSKALEYFLPENNVPVRMGGPSDIELTLPPYCGQSRLLLGRAVTIDPAEFRVEQLQ